MVILGCVIVIIIMVLITEIEKKRMRQEVETIRSMAKQKDKIFNSLLTKSEQVVEDFEILTEILKDSLTVDEINEMYRTKKAKRKEEQ